MATTKEEDWVLKEDLNKIGYLKFNYIVSGLERSGTSLMMQILEEIAQIPVIYDNELRISDEHNKKGYYETFGGDIIGRLKTKDINMNDFKESFIKITAYGLQYIPEGHDCKVIYMERNIDEIIKSRKKMCDTEIENDILVKLNNESKHKMDINRNFLYIVVNYNDLMVNPIGELQKLKDFLDIEFSSDKIIQEVIDDSLYRCRGG